MKILLLAAALLGTTVSAPAFADPISGLFNTGANATGTGVTIGNGADLHWTLAGGPAFNGGTNGQFPIGPWLEETSTSRWLTPTANASDGVAAGDYDYVLTFDLTGFNSTTASFTARAAADDGGQLFLNGLSFGTVGSFTQFTNGLTASSGFLPGVNTLLFRSTNGGGPAGARLEFVSSSVSTLAGAVPEPTTWGMMILGFGAMGYAMRRRAKVRTSVSFA